MVEILTLEDLNNLKNEILKELKSLKQDLSSVKRKRRWLKSVEFMEFYGIKSHNTLRLMRENGLVKAEMKLSEWYYDTDSFLPS